jgi:Big-like domain-containing protein
LNRPTTTLSSSLNPSTYGQNVTFTAKVTSSLGAPPDGETVTFKQGSTVLGTGTLSSGSASFSTSALAVGTKPITAVYPGDANLAGSTSQAVSQVVNKANTTTTLVSSRNPSSFNEPVTFTATVEPEFSGTPTGTVTFSDGSTPLGMSPLSGGMATFSTAVLAAGLHSINAVYSGDSNFLGGVASLNQRVNQASTTLALGSSVNPSGFGQPVTLTAMIATQYGGQASGTITFKDGSTTLGSSTVSGNGASLTASSLAIGRHSIADSDLRQIYSMGQGRFEAPTSESDRDRGDRTSGRNESESRGYLRKRRHESQNQDAGASSAI